MKLPGLTIALLTLVFSSCQKPTAQNTASTPAAKVASTARDARPAAVPLVFEKPVPGRFFLRREIAVETSSGISRYSAGAAVSLTGRGKYRSADGRTLALAARDVTNDPVEARSFSRRDAPVSSIAVPPGPSAAVRISRLAPRTAFAATPAARAPLTSTSPLNRPAYGATQAFVDTDGDGRKFDLHQRSRNR